MFQYFVYPCLLFASPYAVGRRCFLHQTIVHFIQEKRFTRIIISSLYFVLSLILGILIEITWTCNYAERLKKKLLKAIIILNVGHSIVCKI